MNRNKKLAIVAGTTAVAMAGAGVAFAYISGGSGTNTANATTQTSANLPTALTVTVTPPSNLVPGAAASAVGVSVQNTHSYSVHFTSLAVALGSLGACAHTSPAWIVLGGTTSYAASGGYTIAPNSTDSTTFANATVAFNDDPSNDQGACTGQNVPVTATITP
jgi:hypothetical protein